LSIFVPAPIHVRPKRAPVDGGVRADLHVVVDLNDSGLWDFEVTSILELETKAVAAQNDTAMHNHARSYDATCARR
jgi:hypothetical protein